MDDNHTEDKHKVSKADDNEQKEHDRRNVTVLSIVVNLKTQDSSEENEKNESAFTKPASMLIQHAKKNNSKS